MSVLPTATLARHGETAWSVTGQHTGRTDIALTESGECNAIRLGERLKGRAFVRVWTSPSRRARRTSELAGFGSVAAVDPDLAEWDYGAYEGLRSADIHKERPKWELFRDGVPGGETLGDLEARADRVIARIRAADGDVLLFSSGHILRVLTARWLGLNASEGRLFLLGTASVSTLGYERDLSSPVLRSWNDTGHVLS